MQYKYHKGSEADFFGAPEWCTCVVIFEGQKLFEEHAEPKIGLSRWQEDGCEMINTWDEHTKAGGEIIAHREPIPEGKASVTIINNSTDQLIAERGSRYGKFKDGAAIMQELKFVMREVDGWHHLTPSQKEALDMIQHKIGRILNGDPTYDDSWKDIAGYATLIVNELSGEVK